MVLQRSLEPKGVNRKSKAGQGHHVTPERVLSPEQSIDPYHTLTAYRGHLGGGAILEDGHQGDRTALHEVHAPQRLVRLAEDLAARQ